MRRTATLLLALAVLLGAACGSDEDPTVDVPTGAGDATSTSTTTTTGATSSTTEVETDTDDDAEFATSAEIASQGYGQLVAVRHAAQPDAYRVVFEFEDEVPGAKIGFTDRPVVQDGSGNEIAIAGDRVLLVQFEPASGFDMDASEESYTGPKRLEVELAPVVEIVRVSDFEAHLDWAIGVDDGSTFRAFALSSPARIVVDIKAVPDA